MERHLALVREWMRRLLGLVRRGPADRDLEDELASHLALAEEDLRARGESADAAARLARVRFGRPASAMEALREQRGVPWVDSLWLDVRLGVRLLRRSWGLTLAGGLAMTLALVIAAVVFTFLDDLLGRGTLPLQEGGRVVAIQTWDPGAHLRRDTSLQDLERWRERLRRVEDLGGFQTVERRLVVDDGPGEWVRIAEMSAAGFRLARVAPTLGRPIVEGDEPAGAAPVVVIGHDAWQSRFASDPDVLGRTVRIGDAVHTVVGVMPEGFAFPFNHRYWIPLRTDGPGHLRHAPDGVVFARLAPGASLETAQAELSAVGLLPPATADEASQQRRPRVVRYTFAFTDDVEPGELAWRHRVILFLVALLLVPPCANVAILVYARTVARQTEFVARSALGASRGRIVGQIFVEVLVLAGAAAGAALLLARPILREVGEIFGRIPDLDGTLPFWADFDVSLRTVTFVLGLAVLAALMAGLVPALQATGRMIPSGLRTLGGRAGVPLGATWTTLVVVQVAFTLAVLPSAVEVAWGNLRPGILGPGFQAGVFLTARLLMDPQAPPVDTTDQSRSAARFRDLQVELARRLEAESVVSRVTLSAATPGDEPLTAIELDEGPDGPRRIRRFAFRVNRVDEAFFEVFDIPLLAGGGFGAGDVGFARTAVVVDQTFVEQVMGEGSALGRRIRRASPPGEEPGPWYEIVGVVPNRPAHTSRGRIYFRADRTAPGELTPVSLAVHAGPRMADAARRLARVAAELDPALRVEDIRPLDDVFQERQTVSNIPTLILGAVTLSVILLSAVGLYSLMSFTVSRRRREIGIRSALGARAPRLLAGVLRRALLQVSLGAAVGVAMALLLHRALNIEPVGGAHIPGVLPVAVALVAAIGVLAAAGPARRALLVDPTQALREDG
jgi:predicted permease